MGRALWKNLTRPWLAALMEDVTLCRVIVGLCAALGAASILHLSLWPCFFHALTGLPCPGCGMTRAVSALLQGDWHRAMRYHPLSPAYVVFGTLLTLSAVSTPALRRTLISAVQTLERKTALPAFIVLATVIFGLLRMTGACSNPAVTKPPVWSSWFQE